MGSFTIRPGETVDCTALAKLLIETWQNCYTEFFPADFLNQLDQEKQEKRHQAYMSAGTHYYLAENANKKLLAFISYGPDRSSSDPNLAELYTLYVDKQQHQKGIGKALLDKAIFLLQREKRFHFLNVTVFTENPYLPFYFKNGFQEKTTGVIDFGTFSKDVSILQRVL